MRASHTEIQAHKEFKKMEEMYLLALKREVRVCIVHIPTMVLKLF